MGTAIYMVFIIIANLLIYLRTINNDLVMDDVQWWRTRKTDGVFKLSQIKNLAHARRFLDDRLYSGTTFGLNKRVEHSFRIFLHTTICLLMFWAFGHNQISYWAAILYSCNPINNQTSCWLNGRRYTVAIIAVLLMMIFPLSSLVLYPFTMLLQVTAVFSPVLLIGHSPWFLAIVPAAFAMGWGRIKVRCKARSDAMAEGDLKTFKWTRLIVIVKTYGFFFWKMLFPGVCAMQYPDRLKWGLTEEGNKDAYSIEGDFCKGIVALVFSGCLIVWLPNAYKPLAVFMALATLQWSAVLPITQILSDRYCSLPNVFMMFFVSYFAHMAGGFYVPIVVTLECYYVVCLSVVLPMYENLTEWYGYHFRYFPGLSWYRHNLISDLINEGQKDLALQHTITGLMNDKKDFRLLMWGSILSCIQGNLKEAGVFLDEAEKNFYINKEEEQRGEIAEARIQIKKLEPIYKKAKVMTEKEKDLLLKRRGVRRG